MIEWVALSVAVAALVIALILLIILTAIDLRERLLPNIYVFPFAVLGLVFHAATNFELISLEQSLLGGIGGYLFLWLIRQGGNWYYQQESLGLGDVKLIGAAGLWLGPEHMIIAVIIGASASLVHGLIYAAVKKLSLKRLEIPAGPGLIFGIIAMIAWMLRDPGWLMI